MAFTTISKHTDYFNTVLYTGNGSTQSITGVGHQPDFTWIKNRSTTHDHILTDVVRGVTKDLRSNNTDAEATDSNGLTAFGTDGFTVGSKANINNSGSKIVSWNWKAGNSQGSSNTDGSINTTYTSVNTTAGFSISTYTGTGSNATVGHGLGVAPKMIIIKNLSDSSGHWRVYHASVGNTKYLDFDNTGAAITSSIVFNNTTPTNTVFSIGSDSRANGNGNNMVAYCFAEKTGYSKFGSYTGTGSDGRTFVYTGFRPEFVIVKRYNNTEEWQMTDAARDKDVSPNFARLKVDNSTAESTNTTWAKIEKFSNGFRLGGTDTVTNGSGDSYIYMAFGQSLVGSNNVPCTAR